MTEHRELREALGAYVLGALDPAERHRVEEHLAGCEPCKAELARLAAVPPLLARVSAGEVAEQAAESGRPDARRSLAAIAVSRREERRRLVTWRVAALVAALAAIAFAVVPVLDADPPADRQLAALRPVAADAAELEGSAAAVAWEWGTTLELDLEGLPERDAYRLWAVDTAGRRQPAGTWGPTAAREVYLHGACAVDRDELDRVEVTDENRDVLFTLDFSRDRPAA